MKKKPTYGEVVETFTVLLAVLGIALCLQMGLFSQSAVEGYTTSGTANEQLCCVQISDVDHQHTDASESRDPVLGAVDLPHFSPKFYAALASVQPQPLQPCLVLQYHRELSPYVATRIADRHILYRCLRI